MNEGHPVTSVDNGANFTCLVANPAIQGRNISRKFNLNVLYPPEFESTLVKYEVVEGERVQMEVDRQPMPSLPTLSTSPPFLSPQSSPSSPPSCPHCWHHHQNHHHHCQPTPSPTAI